MYLYVINSIAVTVFVKDDNWSPKKPIIPIIITWQASRPITSQTEESPVLVPE